MADRNQRVRLGVVTTTLMLLVLTLVLLGIHVLSSLTPPLTDSADAHVPEVEQEVAR